MEGDEKVRKKLFLLSAAVLCLFLLAGCKGKALPDGMTEETVLSAGQEIVDLLVEGDCQGVYDRLRQDVQTTTTVEEIISYRDTVLDGVGEYKQVSNSMVTGITDEEQQQGIAVIYCKYDKKSIRFRVAFDPDMELIGFAMAKK